MLSTSKSGVYNQTYISISELRRCGNRFGPDNKKILENTDDEYDELTDVFICSITWMQRNFSFIKVGYVNDETKSSRFTGHLVLAQHFIYC